MRLRVLHETRYQYSPAVATAQHMLHLTPLTGPTQRLLSHRLDIDPAPSERSALRDVHGNTRTFIALQSPHNSLCVLAESEVDTLDPGPAPEPALAEQPWEAARERLRYRAGVPCEPAAEFVFASPHAPRHDDFAAYARPSFPPGAPLLPALQDLMARIHRDFRYESQSTDVGTPALEALAQRRGVCQDFAHIMIACVRALGLPARYVSGYLLTEPPPGQPRLVGSDASHAWVSAYLPGAEPGQGAWYDLDPTNDRSGPGSPGPDYVALALGRDFADVSPMRGVIHGGASHTLVVAVTVLPLEGLAPADANTPATPSLTMPSPTTPRQAETLPHTTEAVAPALPEAKPEQANPTAPTRAATPALPTIAGSPSPECRPAGLLPY